MTQSTFKANEVPSFARVLWTIPRREFYLLNLMATYQASQKNPNKYQ